ncbi:MAG: PEP-CTERM sorting domain-containing protein [Bryobacteraceae bacterium]|jgi:hypothetical protein
MVRFIAAAGFGLMIVASANAGQIEIGGSSGLSNTIIATPGGFTESSFSSTMFAGASGTFTVPQTLTDGAHGVTFNLDSDGASGGNATEYWNGASDGTPSKNEITVPVNAYGVTSAWTLLNLDAGNTTASRDDQVIFNWSNGSSLTVMLCANTAQCTAAGGNAGAQIQIEDAVLCLTNCGTGDYGPLANGTPYYDAFTSNTPAGFAASNVTVDTNTLFSEAFSDGSGQPAGNVVLNDQGFIFSGATLANSLANTLVSIQIKEQDTTAGYAVGLSAVTVNNTVPEPSTIVLLLAGLGAIGFRRLRRA